ncbi:paxillin-B-like isoform X2 [Varroa jacobsoni]|uniref:paxillin-B-like isoform X2 n=1 Tax=Varroa jacobsoni TaxID=62625 RepID=UPI000BF4F72C|nr:paxillin-B-like isoform X2 [Varroa jacobsoni]
MFNPAPGPPHILGIPSINDGNRQVNPQCSFCAKEIYEGELEDVPHERLKWHRNTCFRCSSCSLPLVRGRPYIIVQEGALCMECFATTRNQNADCSWQENVTVQYRARRVHFNNNAIQRVYSPEASIIEEPWPQAAKAPMNPALGKGQQCFSTVPATATREGSPALHSLVTTSRQGPSLVSQNIEDLPALDGDVDEGLSLNASSSWFNDLANSFQVGGKTCHPNGNSSSVNGGSNKKGGESKTFPCSTPPPTPTDLEKASSTSNEQSMLSSPSVDHNGSAGHQSLKPMDVSFDRGSKQGSPHDLDSHQERPVNEEPNDQDEVVHPDGNIEVARHSPRTHRVRGLQTPSPPYNASRDTSTALSTISDVHFGSSTPEKGGRPVTPLLSTSYNGAIDSTLEITSLHKEDSGQGKFICYRCARKVYGLDCLNILDRHYHRSCFRCCKCPARLDQKNYFDQNKDPYCRKCYQKSAMTPKYNPSPAYDRSVLPDDNSKDLQNQTGTS